MKKTIAGVVLGLVTWIVVASVGNRLLRAGMAGYRDVETTMAFTQPMMLARLVLGAVSSLSAGYVAACTAGAGRARQVCIRSSEPFQRAPPTTLSSP